MQLIGSLRIAAVSNYYPGKIAEMVLINNDHPIIFPTNQIFVEPKGKGIIMKGYLETKHSGRLPEGRF